MNIFEQLLELQRLAAETLEKSGDTEAADEIKKELTIREENYNNHTKKILENNNKGE